MPGPSQEKSSPLNAAVERYLAYLQLERGASPRTIASYGSDLKQLLAYLQQQGITHPSSITHACVSGYLAGLTTRRVAVGRPSRQHGQVLHPLSAAAAARQITTLRTFLRFLFHEGLLSQDLSHRIGTPRQKRKLPHTLSLAFYERLLAAIPTHTPQGLRDRAMVELMFGSGLRVSEVCALRLTDLDEEAGFLRVMGKGSKERIVPVGSATLSALRAYVQGGRPALAGQRRISSHCFLSARGVGVSRITVWLMLKTAAGRAGLPAELIKPHGLRHSFATELLRGGADLRVVQGLLGHSSVATTQIYTAVSATHLDETHALYHPRRSMSTAPKASG